MPMQEGFPSFLDPSDILGESPQATFFSFQDQFGDGQTQRRFFQNQFTPIFNQFLGTLGQDLRQGQLPEQTFESFLETFNFGEQFARLAPSIRGATTQRFAPPARFFNI
jgi:hypothetical protein